MWLSGELLARHYSSLPAGKATTCSLSPPRNTKSNRPIDSPATGPHTVVHDVRKANRTKLTIRGGMTHFLGARYPRLA